MERKLEGIQVGMNNSNHGSARERGNLVMHLSLEKKGVVKSFFTRVRIFLGLGFTGLMDELSIFNQQLTDKQAMELYQLKGGIKSIL